MKASTKRILSIGLAGFFFLGILVVYGNFIRSEMTKVSEKRALATSKETLFNNQRAAVEQMQGLISQFQSIVRLQETVSLALPLEENITQVLNQLQSIAKLSQVTVQSFSVRPAAFEKSKQPLVKRLGVLDLSVSIGGSYEGLKSFLRSLETNVRVANVETFNLTPSGVGEGLTPGDNYSMTLAVKIYYQE